MKWICEWFIINILQNSERICVAWILQLFLLSGPVKKEAVMCQHSKQHNPPAIQSVIELRKGTTGRHNFQPDFFQWSCSLLLASPHPCLFLWSPAPPSHNCAMTYCHEINDLFARFRFAADFMFYLWACIISMFWGLNSWFSKVLLHSSNSSTAPRLITGCCCCLLCRLPLTYSSFPWSGPRGSPHPCEVACARWCGLGPWPPRSLWSCAEGRTHGLLERNVKRIRIAMWWQNHSTSQMTSYIVVYNIVFTKN